jgi:hypothetical protein
MFKMLRLDDSQLEQVKAAAKPLPYRLREPFLRALSKALEGRPITMALLQKTCQQCQQHVMGLHALVPDDDLSFLG